MSWEQFDAEGGGAAYVKLNIGDTFTGTVLRLVKFFDKTWPCLLYTSPSPRD